MDPPQHQPSHEWRGPRTTSASNKPAIGHGAGGGRQDSQELHRAEEELTPAVKARDSFYEKAHGLITAPAAKRAFNLGLEPPHMTALKALSAARIAGIRLHVEGDDLLLDAPTAPPSAVIDALSCHKASIVALLLPARDGWSAEDRQVFFDERAGILEFDGGLSRSEAEAQAFECCMV